jgi:hypothetical protein
VVRRHRLGVVRAPGAEGWTGVAPEQDQGGPTNTTPPGATTTIPVPTTEPTVGPGASSVPGGGGPATTVAPPGARPDDSSDPPVGQVVLVALLAVGLWVLLMPPLVRSAVRWRRRRPEDRVLGAWRAAATALGAIGAGRRPGDTPLEHAKRAARLTGLDPASLAELAGYATRTVYSTNEAGPRVATRAEELRRYVVSATRDLTPWQARWRARLDPRRVARLA